MEKPKRIFLQSNGRYAVIVKNEGNYFSVIEINKDFDEDLLNGFSGGQYNFFATAYKIGNIEKYIENHRVPEDLNAVKSGKTYIVKEVEIVKEDVSQSGSSSRGPSHLNDTSSTKTIPQQSRSGNNKMSITPADEYVTLSPERIDSIISEYATSSETSNYSQAYITSIHPTDFLKLTISDEALEKWTPGSVNEWGQEVRDLEADDLKNSERMPYLRIASAGEEGNRIIGNEGRHRMLALLRAGYDEVPVVLIDNDTKNSKVREDSTYMSPCFRPLIRDQQQNQRS